MILEVENLRVEFAIDGRRSIPVNGVSFSVPKGARVALVGESGCGKTLTALAVGSLVDRAKVSGGIKLHGKISYIFQNPMQSLDPVMRVGNQIMEGMDASLPSSRRKEFSQELLEAVGLPRALVRRYPCELSGGQQQRVMIASALAQNPQMLVADEPTTALDVTTQKEVLDLIDRVAGERKMAVLLITHNLGLVSRYSSYVNVMYAGKIVESGEVKSVLASPRHPYTKGLIAAVPRIDAPQDAPLVDIPGTVPPPWAWPQGCAFHPRCRNALPECSSENFTICRYLTGNQQF